MKNKSLIKLNKVENLLNELKEKLINKTCTEQDLEKKFLSIKTQLKDIEVFFLNFISKNKQTKLLKRLEDLRALKIKIDQLKKERNFEYALNKIDNFDF